ncbi:MAG: fibronectin type III domain-containing protein [Oscillospiraceae bacterium]|nr:fibronectin type III domain-containing protein [Oscillospiraceae bacterium]
MNMKKLTAIAAAVVMAAGICTGVHAGTGNGSPLAITAEASTKQNGKLEASVKYSGTSIDIKWSEVKNAASYYIAVLYSTADIPFNIEENRKIFSDITIPADSDLSVSISTIGFPVSFKGKPYHYYIQVVPLDKQGEFVDDTTYFTLFFESIDDLEKTVSNDIGGTAQTTVTGNNVQGLENLPNSFSATGGDKKIDVKWDKAEGAKSYEIWYSDAGMNRYIKDGDTSSTSYTINSLTNGKAYDIMIVSDKSGQYCVMLKNVLVGEVRAAVPSNFKASKTNNSITLSWDKADGAAMYRVYKYNDKTGKYEKYKDVKTEKCTVSGLSANTKYKFKIVSYSKADGKYVKGESSKAVSITTKK